MKMDVKSMIYTWSFIVLSVLLVMMITTSMTLSKAKRATIFFGYSCYCTVTNDEGESLRYEQYGGAIGPNGEDFVGDMKKYKTTDVEETGYYVEVNESKTFIFKTIDDPYKIEVMLDKADGSHLAIVAKNAESVVVDGTDVTVIPTKGKKCRYYISVGYNVENKEYTIEGKTEKILKFQKRGNGMIANRLNEKVRFSIYDNNKKGKDRWAGGIYYFYNENVRFYKKGRKLKISSGIKVEEEKKKKGIRNLKLYSANEGRNMFLRWDKVKKARSYVVYKYDPTQKKYLEMQTVKDTFLDIPVTEPNELHKYKVIAKSKAKGKGKKVCRLSYRVFARSSAGKSGNVNIVKTNRKKITGKSGKKIRLKAKVTSKSTKPLLSTKVRWYTSNKKIARINMQTGKVKFLRKGKCFIWAKAHNGKNSRKIKVVVK